MGISEKRRIGDIGESIACRYLAQRGYRILERNYWKPWGEIDIIAQKANSLIFIEVKSVSHENFKESFSRETAFINKNGLRPEENMHPAKIKRLERVIGTYLLDRQVAEGRAWQVDLACVYLDFKRKKAKVELLENVF